MKRALGISLLLALAACQAAPTVRRPTTVAATATATPAAAATARPATPSPSPVPSPADLGRLLKPTTPVVELSGQVQIDPAYLVGQGAGKVVSNNGSSVLELAGGALSADGNLIANNAASIITNNGGGIVSDNGGGIISDNGGGLTSKVKRGLLEEAELVPAAGMAVGLRSLRTGQPLPVGVDAAGKPVYVVYTNLSGGYQLFVPAEEAGNVLVVANPPAKQEQRYDLVAATGARGLVDDDTTVTTRLIRKTAIHRWLNYLTADPKRTQCLVDDSDAVPPELKPVIQASLAEIYARAQAHGVTADPALAAAVYALAERCSDRVLAGVDLDALTFGDLGQRIDKAPTDGVLAAETVLVAELRRDAARVLKANPTFFDTQPWLVEANACDPGRYLLRQPMDALAFVADEYIANLSDPSLQRTAIAMASLSTEARGTQQAHQLMTMVDVMTNAVVAAYLASAHGEQDAINALIDGFDPAHPPATAGEAPYAEKAPCPRASKVPEDSTCQ